MREPQAGGARRRDCGPGAWPAPRAVRVVRPGTTARRAPGTGAPGSASRGPAARAVAAQASPSRVASSVSWHAHDESAVPQHSSSPGAAASRSGTASCAGRSAASAPLPGRAGQAVQRERSWRGRANRRRHRGRAGADRANRVVPRHGARPSAGSGGTAVCDCEDQARSRCGAPARGSGSPAAGRGAVPPCCRLAPRRWACRSAASMSSRMASRTAPAGIVPGHEARPGSWGQGVQR